MTNFVEKCNSCRKPDTECECDEPSRTEKPTSRIYIEVALDGDFRPTENGANCTFKFGKREISWRYSSLENIMDDCVGTIVDHFKRYNSDQINKNAHCPVCGTKCQFGQSTIVSEFPEAHILECASCKSILNAVFKDGSTNISVERKP